MTRGRPRKGREYGLRWAKEWGSRSALSEELVGPGATFPEHLTLQPVLKSMAREGIIVKSEPYDNKRRLYWLTDEAAEELLKED